MKNKIHLLVSAVAVFLITIPSLKAQCTHSVVNNTSCMGTITVELLIGPSPCNNVCTTPINNASIGPNTTMVIPCGNCPLYCDIKVTLNTLGGVSFGATATFGNGQTITSSCGSNLSYNSVAKMFEIN